jgi:hypothetical protein
MDELNNLFNHVLKDKLGYPETYEIYRVGRNTIVFESKYKGAKKLLIDKIKSDADFREKLLKELENIIRFLDYGVSDMTLSFQDYNIVVQFKTSNEVPALPYIIKTMKPQFTSKLINTKLLTLPVELHAIITSYLDLPDLQKVLYIYGQELDNYTFWTTYLISKHPYLILTRDTRGVELQGNPMAYDIILSYYDKKEFYKLTQENKIYDNINENLDPYANNFIKTLLNGSKYHYDQITRLYKDHPREFETLLKYGLLRREDYGYLISILEDPELIRKYYLEGNQAKRDIIQYHILLGDYLQKRSNFQYYIEKNLYPNSMDHTLRNIYKYTFLINYLQNVVKAMEYFKVDKF